MGTGVLDQPAQARVVEAEIGAGVLAGGAWAGDVRGRAGSGGTGLRPEVRPRRVLLLAGSIRPTGLESAVGRSLLDLPVSRGTSVLDVWQEQVGGLAASLGIEQIDVQVLVNAAAARPAIGQSSGRVSMVITEDPLHFRGSGGVLRDVVAGCDAQEYVLVANAGQLLQVGLDTIFWELLRTGAEVALTSNVDGTPTTAMLVRCGCLGEIPPVGFVDLKEQALRAIARRHRVSVVSCRSAIGLPVRTLGDYIAALQAHHRRAAGVQRGGGAFAEDWQASFGVIEQADSVHRTARIHDSVVLSGGRVEADAVVVRSVICAGATIRRGRRVVDEIVTAAGANGARARRGLR